MNEENGVNRRTHVRFRFQTPFLAELSLWRVRDRGLRSRAQKVIVRDISLGGCSFISKLQLPLREDVEWLVQLELGHYTAKPRLILLHRREEEGSIVYGGRWIMTALERQAFQFRFNDYVRLMLLESPHIHTLYKKIADRNDDGQFKHLDVTS
ncbi:PilZ domain-containing protein [Cohnella terricola]|uniref:PilZ domain-containing protein n=1 Tax=Cohnella terricola TaxID=1289167 RepID=A0A559JMM7_9BACL|nr:PilZ domain-containing protein [Cohnella terricola]TVY01135.1 hypothetical protein FPZ45_08235 [Cohnella terricola]